VFVHPAAPCARGENDRHLNGVFMAARSSFLDVNGYDERITLYGYDDSHLYHQMQSVPGASPLDIARESASGESLIEHVVHPYHYLVDGLVTTCENHAAVDIAESMEPWKNLSQSQYAVDEEATEETRARFGADATGVVLGGAGGVHVNYFVHNLVSWAPSLIDVIGNDRWAELKAQCGESTAAARLGDGSDEVAATAEADI